MSNINTVVIIVNWNNAADTCACLASLKKSITDKIHVVVVDNGSTDDSLIKIKECVRDRPFQCHLIELKENQGFSGGNNVGIEYAIKCGAQYVLLLNNDTLVSDNFLDKLLHTASSIDNLGVLGCRIHYADDKEKVWFNGGGINYLKGIGYHVLDKHFGLRECDFVSGCMMLIPTQVLKDVGVFDERFFLLWEDADLCFRIKNKGYRIIVDGDSCIYHKVSSSIGGEYSACNQYYYHRNRFLFFQKHLNFPQRVSFYVMQLIMTPLFILMCALRSGGRSLRWNLLAYRDFFCSRFNRSCWF